MPDSVERDVLCDQSQLMSAAVLPSEAVMEVRKKIVGFVELLQSFDDEKRNKADWP